MVEERSTSGWGRLGSVAAVATYALIVFGGIVRITGSGMGCGDHWPLCNGRLIPSLEFETLIEYGHRLAAVAVSLLVLALAALAWLPGGRTGPKWRRLRRLGTVALALLAVQILLGAVTVWLELPAASVILHLGTAMLLLAALEVGALEAAASTVARHGAVRDRAQAIGWWSAVFALVVVLAGAVVANTNAAPACQGFPLCNGRWVPGENPLSHIHWGHRVLAYGFFVWAVAVPYLVRRNRREDGALRRAALIAAALTVVQFLVGALMVLRALPDDLRSLHVALGTAVFGALVVVAWLAGHPAVSAAAAGEAPAA